MHLRQHPGRTTGPRRDHDQGRHHQGWLWDTVADLIAHSHHTTEPGAQLASNERGIWALKVSLAGLFVTALIQVTVVLISGSVALLADTLHNFSDALTAVPLWLAFSLMRRPPSHRYTYGYGRAEDLAGVTIVGVILFSSVWAAYESIDRLFHPQTVANAGWVIVAAFAGFLGNELVAQFRIKVGREIGSAALVADGQHARLDGLSSLAVFLGAVLLMFGLEVADPVIGLIITVAIVFIAKDTAILVWHRLMDAVDPGLVHNAEQLAAAVPGVVAVHDVRARWLGRRLLLDLHITVDGDLRTTESHRIAEEVRHVLLHRLPFLGEVTVHVDPYGSEHHLVTEHHFPRPDNNRAAS